VTHAVSNEHSDAGSPIGAANEVIASSFTLPVESPAALWRDWAASFNWSLVFRWNQIAVATVGGVNLEQRHPNSAAAFSGNSFIGSGSPRIETTYSSLDGQSFMQDNYWGPTTTAEMDTKGAAANISAFHDIWEDALLGRILYDDWAATAYPMPQIDSPGFGAIVELGEPIHFNGFADDLEDGPIPGAQLSWYSEEAGELGTGNALTRFDLSIGTHKVWLTATDSSGQQSKTWTKVVVKSAVTDVTTDTDHGCGLSGGGLWCWGNNQDGQLGVGTYSDSAVPVRVGSEQDWTSVSAGFSHTCALRGGAVWCWGNNQWGQLGDGPTESRPVPNRVGATNDWTEIVAGYSESCGLKSGQLWCWGLIGDPWPTPVDSANDWTAVTLGLNFACGIRAGQLWCWGNNSSGQLGDGTKGHRTTPTRVGSATDWSAVSAGSAFTCGVRVGTLWCWGENGAGEAGLGAAGSPFLSPVQLGSASDWSALATGDKHACAVRNGTLWCWGSNQDGRRGDNVSDLGIRQVGFADAWSQVACGRQHTCGLLGRDLWCWGRNSAGQVGSGDPVGVLLPPVPIRF